jgi:23S rRNA (uracil-5-)-methyltransferase RumA
MEGMGDGPDAIARVGDYVVFVAGALPGERVLAKVTSAARKFGRAELLEVERASPDRVAPRCAHFGTCGGCQLQHVAPAAQARLKTERLAKTLRHFLGRDIAVDPMRAPRDPWRQRTKLAWLVDGTWQRPVAGFLRARSREVIRIEECPVHDPAGYRVAELARDAAFRHRVEPWDARSDRGVLRAIVVRSAPGSGATQVVLVARRRDPSLDEAARDVMRAIEDSSVVVNLNDGPFDRLLGHQWVPLYGPRRIVETIEGIDYHASPGTFFQTSDFGATALVATVRELLAAPREARVLDLYCGGGLLALAVARDVAEVLGIEQNRVAVEDAVVSAEANDIPNARFLAGPVARELAALPPGPPPAAVILDPPRAGAEPEVLERLAALAPPVVLYVACEPAALGRDAAQLERGGWRLQRVVPIEMFPQTAHLEAVARFERAAT